MQSTQNHSKNSGFTLVEVMIIAPIVILVISGFVALIIVLTGDVLRTAATTKAAFDVQTALDTFEEDTKVATAILDGTTSITPMNYQGMNNVPGATLTNPLPTKWTGTNNIRLRTLATTKNPLDPTAKLVYVKDSPHACSSANVSQNLPFTVDVVYYTTFIPGSNPAKYKIWRRTVFPSNFNVNNLCGGTVWQQPSCHPDLLVTTAYAAVCKTEDQEVFSEASSGFTSSNTTYYANPVTNAVGFSANSTTSTIQLNLNVNKTVAGRDINYTGTLRTTALGSTSYKNFKPTLPTGTQPGIPIFDGNFSQTIESEGMLKWRIPSAAGSTPISSYNIRVNYRDVCSDGPQVIKAVVTPSAGAITHDTGVYGCTGTGSGQGLKIIADAYVSAVNGSGAGQELGGLYIYGYPNS